MYDLINNQTYQFQERNFEYSELLLYQNTIYQEAGYVDAALKHLNENSEHIVDKLALTEYKCEYWKSMNQMSAVCFPLG